MHLSSYAPSEVIDSTPAAAVCDAEVRTCQGRGRVDQVAKQWSDEAHTEYEFLVVRSPLAE